MKINVTQSVSAKRPTYIKNAINNLPALRFASNINLFSAVVSIDQLALSDQVTVFFVQNNFSDISTTTTFSFGNNFGAGQYRFLIQARGLSGSAANQFWFGICCPTQSRFYTGASYQTFNQNKIYSAIKNGSFGNLRVNFNEMDGSNSSFSQSVPSTEINSFFVGTNFVGYIAELIIFNRSLKEAERYEIEKYLSKKWEIKI